MRGFFLLLLSLMTGCEASTQVKGCLGGWVQFTCQHPHPGKYYSSIYSKNKTQTFIKGTKPEEWVTKGRVSVYHDKSGRNMTVFIKQLQTQDVGEWSCKFGGYNHSPTDTIKLSLDSDGLLCKRPFIQTAYNTSKTTITCEYPDHKYDSDKVFLCKELTKLQKQTESVCEDVLSGGKFTLRETDRGSGFSVSISEVSSQHQGVYWCGLKSERFRAGVRKINLKVEDIHQDLRRNATVGETFSYWCKYFGIAPITKFICKGEDPSVCQTLISTNNKTNGRFSMEDKPKERNITITVRNVTAEDSGTYWCGAKSTNKSHSNVFYHRFFMTVAPSPSSTSVSTTHLTPTSKESPDGRGGVGSELVNVVVCVILLLILLALSVLIYKRFFKRSRSGTEAGAGAGAGAGAQHNKENYIYEEIPERIQNPDSIQIQRTVYATVDFPRNPSASLLYSTIDFKQSSNKAAGDGVTLKPSSSTCEYSSVKLSPADTLTNHQPVASEEPLYSTVNL